MTSVCRVSTCLTAEQKRYAEVQSKLSELGSRFSNQLLDATQAWTKHVTDEAALAGLTDSAKAQMAAAAQAKDLDGWLITLEFPSYYAVMTYAQDRALREEVYAAYCTRASDQGPNAGQNDNGPVMEEILDLRQELARLLGFASFSELSLATKMAESSDQVLSFLRDLAKRSKPFAAQDLEQLKAYAAEQGCPDLQSWDSGFYGEKLREQRYSVAQEALRAYFPIDKVLGGLFAIVQRLYGIEIAEQKGFDTWHPDVRLFEIKENGQHVGRFFFDLYARANKRGGAWMDGARDRRRTADGVLQSPVANLVCNFTPADSGKPALLTHDEVTTLFHEFGHGLHHLLTRVEHAGVSRHQRRGLGCGRAAKPVHGKLVLGAGRSGADLRSLRNRRAAASGPAGKNARGEELPVRPDDGAPAGILAVRLRTARHPSATAAAAASARRCVRDEVSVMRPPAYNRFPTASRTSSPAVTRRVTTATNGRKCCRPMRSRNSKKTACSMPPPVARSAKRSWRAAVPRSRWCCSSISADGEPSIDALLRHSGLSEGAAA